MAIFRRIWNRFTRPAARYGAGVLLAIGAAGGIAFAVGFDYAVEYTNSTEFCLSCHTLQWVAAEWEESHHHSGRTGVRAECQDCHVPDALFPKMWAKIRASNDVYHQIMGTIDTEEKFMERRPLLAQRVWDRMEARDSRQCRTCHMEELWDPEAQSGQARREHAEGEEEGMTCIQCHKGVAHEYPKEEPEPDAFEF